MDELIKRMRGLVGRECTDVIVGAITRLADELDDANNRKPKVSVPMFHDEDVESILNEALLVSSEAQKVFVGSLKSHFKNRGFLTENQLRSLKAIVDSHN